MLQSKKSEKPRDQEINFQIKELFNDGFENLKNKITAQNNEVSERAIEKAHKIIVLYFSLITLVIGVAGFVGWNNLQVTASQIVEKQVSGWFSLNSESSPVKEQLLSMRERYLIDSVTIRYLKAKADDRRYRFEITQKEVDELTRIANQKETPLTDYIDILHAVKAARGRLALGMLDFPGDYRGEAFAQILSEKGFKDQAEKQRNLLSVFYNDYSLVYFAREAIKSEHNFLHQASFKLLAETGQPDAVEYAEKHLNTDGFERQNFTLALYLAKENPRSEKLKQYVSELFANRRYVEAWFQEYFAIFLNLIWVDTSGFSLLTNVDEQQIQFRNEKAEKMFLSMVASGLDIGISEYFDEQLVVKMGDSPGYSLSQSEADKVYKNPDFINNLVKLDGGGNQKLKDIVSALEVIYQDDYIVTIMIDLAGATKLVGSQNEVIDQASVVGPIWLSVDKNSRELQATYRALDGELEKSTIVKYENVSDSDFKFRFNEKDLYRFAPLSKSF